MRKKLLSSMIYVNIANLFDTFTTYIAIQFFDKEERNPLVRMLLEDYGSIAYVIKIIVVFLITAGLCHIIPMLTQHHLINEENKNRIYQILYYFFIFIGTVYTVIGIVNIFRILF